MKTASFFVGCVILSVYMIQAAVLSVPDEYPTIQAGIDASVDGDVVLIADGVYIGTGNRDIHYNSKRIRVESINGPEACIIDCQGSVSDPHTGFIFDTDEEDDSVLIGVTIRNGYAAPGTVTNGGAIYCYSSYPTLINCIFHNHTANSGGALYVLHNPDTMTVFNCLFYNNIASDHGGGLSANLASLNVINSTFTGNTAPSGAGIDVWISDFTMLNCIVWNNTPDGISAPGTPEPEITFCDIQGGVSGVGNLNTDPMFLTIGTTDYFLSQIAAGQSITSPCVDTGLNLASVTCFTLAEMFNCLDEATTRTDGMEDLLTVDMGFHYSFQPWIDPTPTPTSTITPTVTPTPTPHDPIRRVPEDYATIQDAIDAAVDDDIISVADGIYTGTGNCDIRFWGKKITVTSRNGAETCIIDCQGTAADQHRGFYFEHHETIDSILNGFTVKNGYVNTGGGGIACAQDASPLIMNCIIANNYAYTGGGIQLGCGTLLHSIIKENIAEGDWYSLAAGGGIGSVNGTISSCVIRNNTALSGSPGGIICYGDTLIENSVIENNNQGPGIAVYCDHVGAPCGTMNVVNCLITGHDSNGIHGAYNPDYPCSITNSIVWYNEEPGVSNTIDVSYCNIEGGANGKGNIDADPMLIHDLDWGYYLSRQAAGQTADSPCLNAGNRLASQTYVTGADGPVALSTLTTQTDHVADTGKVDMGPHLAAPDVSIPTQVTGVSIYIPSNHYHRNDRFRCEAIVANATGAAIDGYPLFVLLESYGYFFFAPSFSSDPDHYLDEYPIFAEDETLVIVLPEFIWPDAGAGVATWYAALLDPEMSSVFGEWDIRSFVWE